uniref:AMP-dependent synthetase/ligase domain-containing protein n=1 Tax=Glossina austeni TaxID=7395 RepID=A0A1A9VRF4_GLOAU
MISTKSIYDDKEKIWRGIDAPLLYGPNISLGSAILEALMKDPNHITQICHPSGKTYTNGEIASLMIRVAQHFQKLNFKQRDIVGICAANSDFIAPLVFGAWATGLVINTMDVSFDKDGLRHAFLITKPKIMFCDDVIYPVIKEIFDECNLTKTIYTVKGHIEGVPSIKEFLKCVAEEEKFNVPTLPMGGKELAVILYSSGTTGLPKGVCLTHADLLNRMIFKLEPNDRLICFSTLYWLSGIVVVIGVTTAGATRIISENAYSPESFFEIIEQYKATVMFTPPSQLAQAISSPRLQEVDLSNLRTYLCGGSMVSYSLVVKLKSYAPKLLFINGYGMSEASGACTYGEMKAENDVGEVSANMELKVVDDNNLSLGPGKPGELHIRPKFPWHGYYKNPKATAAAYDSEGWIHSGDIGYVDENGRVYILDRKKDIVKYNNFHVYPTEIENTISTIPDVVEVCVCGIPDISSGHLLAAAIVKKSNSTLTENDVYDYVASKMAHFKHLRGGVYFLDSLPKTPSGKNIRREVNNICINKRNQLLNKS